MACCVLEYLVTSCCQSRHASHPLLSVQWGGVYSQISAIRVSPQCGYQITRVVQLWMALARMKVDSAFKEKNPRTQNWPVVAVVIMFFFFAPKRELYRRLRPRALVESSMERSLSSPCRSSLSPLATVPLPRLKKNLIYVDLLRPFLACKVY